MADILIKNIEIPRNIPSRIYLFPNGTVNLNGEDIDAKAIELPRHGELIDRDLWLSTHWVSDVVIDAIKDAPTVVEASK